MGSYPLITLSTRAQVESKRADSTFLKAVKAIVDREGLPGLYAGLDSAIFGISVTNFVYYYFYEYTRAFFERAAEKAGRATKQLTTVESMIAGAIAGSATVIMTNPIWVVNTRMTTRKHQADDKTKATTAADVEEAGTPSTAPNKPMKPLGTLATVMALLKNEGPQALFAGVLPALVLVINPILQYTLFEQMKNAVEKKRRMTPTIAFFLGALGKLFATSVTYPYITVKSQAHVAGREGNKEGMTAAIRRIVKEEGYAGLYKGKFSLLYSRNRPILIPLDRHWYQSEPECFDGRVPLRFQGRPLRIYCETSADNGKESPHLVCGVSSTGCCAPMSLLRTPFSPWTLPPSSVYYTF